ncbi:MAG: hypothetical protein QOJ91_2165 [Sphingomonadales bacterium]|jgi:ABC-type methionine transport system permease subunit|nr:hypothetical protein [Sphingomonadales bacterium]
MTNWIKGKARGLAACSVSLSLAAVGFIMPAPAQALQPCNYMVIRDCKASGGAPYRSLAECIDIESSYVCPGWETQQWPF